VVRELLQRGGMEQAQAASAAAKMLAFHSAVLELKGGKAPGLTEVSCSLLHLAQTAHDDGRKDTILLDIHLLRFPPLIDLCLSSSWAVATSSAACLAAGW
jgi:hypothetical protein